MNGFNRWIMKGRDTTCSFTQLVHLLLHECEQSGRNERRPIRFDYLEVAGEAFDIGLDKEIKVGFYRLGCAEVGTDIGILVKAIHQCSYILDQVRILSEVSRATIHVFEKHSGKANLGHVDPLQ